MALPCLSAAQNDWLRLPSWPGYVQIGDVDVGGTALTVEALIYQQSNSGADIVSKHNDASNVNYLLRPGRAELSTANGFVITPNACTPALNECAHIAMTYDGAFLRHYINGQLNSQTPITGNMVLNNYNAKIGLIASLGGVGFWEQFYGQINEVRIWNVARSANDLLLHLFSPLPTPAAQPGLVACYRFSSLANLQGNAAYNGVLSGSAAIGRPAPCAALGTTCGVLALQPAPEPEPPPAQPRAVRYDPEQRSIRLAFEADAPSRLLIRIFDAQGRLMLETARPLAAGELWQHTLPAGSPGLYTVYWSVNGQAAVRKLAIP